MEYLHSPGSRTARRFVLLALVTVSLASPAASPQPGIWTEVAMIPGPFLFDLCMLPDAQHGWAVGGQRLGGEAHSVIFRTTDGGGQWERLTFPYSSQTVLTGVAFVDADRGWAVGSGGRIYVTGDGGDTWLPQTSGTSRDLNSVCFIDPLHGWITGEAGTGNRHTVLRTSDGGAYWEDISFGSSCYQNDCIFFRDELNGWISGWDNALNPHIHHTPDGGDTWARQALPLPGGSGTVSAVEFATPKIGWATVSSLYQTPAGAILHTTDGGATWDVQDYTGLHYNYALDVQDESRAAIAAVQILTPQQERIFVTSNGGFDWDAFTPPITMYTYGLQFIEEEIWIAAYNSAILRSPDAGVSWEWQHYAPLWNSVAWSSPTEGWIVAGSHVLTDGYCLRTTDGGHTWFRDEGAPGGTRVQFVDADHGWMFFEGNSARVWRTVDGGDVWTQHSAAGGGWIEDMTFINNDRGWVHGGNGTIKRSDDGGQTWTQQNSGVSDFVQAVHFISPDEGWAVGGYGGGSGFIRHTIDGGDNWLPQTPAYPHHFQDVFFLDDQNGWLCGVNGFVHGTSNGGGDWSILAQVPHTYTEEIVMEDALRGWLLARNPSGGAGGEDGRGFIYLTDDGGVTWTVDWTSPWIGGALTDLAHDKEGTPWAVGAHHTILRYVDPAAGPPVAPASRRLHLTGPNPAAPPIQFEFALREAGMVRLVMFDAAGRRVRTLVSGAHPAGSHQVSWDGRRDSGQRVATGVYFGHLIAGGRSATARILLTR